MTFEEFQEYWLTQHVPLAKELPGLRRYRTAVPVEPERSQYDGIAELYFDTVADFEAVLGPESDTEAMRDVENFERDTDRQLVTKTVHVDTLGDVTRSFKLVSVCTRADGIDHEEFVERWAERELPVSQDRGLRKYTTALPIDPDDATADAATADGIAELYFENLGSLTAALSPDGTPGSARLPTDSSIVDHASNHVVEEIVQLDTLG